LVPTMGFLHSGHLSLVREAARRAEKVVVSVYVNEAQFAPGEDLATYPRDARGDLEQLEGLCDVVFMPDAMYHTEEGLSQPQTYVQVEQLQRGLCGVSRPIFFKGVATVVCKLLNIAEPDVAVFGKKDYQQWRIIRQMAHDLDFATEIVGLELVREDDGLAMSSRNVRLSQQERQDALAIYRGLCGVQASIAGGIVDTHTLRESVMAGIVNAGGVVDYVEAVDSVSLEPVDSVTQPVVFAVAAKFGSVRLIDNMEMFPAA